MAKDSREVVMPEKEFASRVEKARKHVHCMDRIDGFADRYLATILSALEAGIRNPENGAQFDAYVMLRDVCESDYPPLVRPPTIRLE